MSNTIWWAAIVIVAVTMVQLVVSGCVPAWNAYNIKMNNLADTAEVMLDELEANYEAEISAAKTEHDIGMIDARYGPAFRAYRSFRAAWIASSSTMSIAEGSGKESDSVVAAAMLGESARAMESFQKAVERLR